MRNRGAKNQSHCADDRYYNLQTKMELLNCTKRSENKTQNNICIPLLFLIFYASSLSYTHKYSFPNKKLNYSTTVIKIEIRSTDEKHGHDCGEFKFTLHAQQKYNEVNFAQTCFSLSS